MPSTQTASEPLYLPVNRNGERIYKGGGLALVKAFCICTRMPGRCSIARVESDGTLTAGHVTGCGEKLKFTADAA